MTAVPRALDGPGPCSPVARPCPGLVPSSSGDGECFPVPCAPGGTRCPGWEPGGAGRRAAASARFSARRAGACSVRWRPCGGTVNPGSSRRSAFSPAVLAGAAAVLGPEAAENFFTPSCECACAGISGTTNITSYEQRDAWTAIQPAGYKGCCPRAGRPRAADYGPRLGTAVSRPAGGCPRPRVLRRIPGIHGRRRRAGCLHGDPSRADPPRVLQGEAREEGSACGSLITSPEKANAPPGPAKPEGSVRTIFPPGFPLGRRSARRDLVRLL